MKLNPWKQASRLQKNPYVQSPQWDDVTELLSKIKISDSYYTRGSKQAQGEALECIEYHRKWISSIIDLSDFKYAYITAGATEAINHWRMSDDRPWQFFEGDYEWPQMIKPNGRKTKYLHSSDVLYVSNPACSDGNFIELNHIKNPVILDCAYLGATAIHKINIPVNTEQVMFSFSKGWGLIGQRCGILYTRDPHPTLEPLKKVECYHYASAQIMKTIMENYQVDEMYKRFKSTQKQLCDDLELQPSDTYFIATSTDDYYEIRRRKSNIARLSLTSILE